MASGPALYVVRVEHRVSSLQLLCQQAIASTLREDKDVNKLTLPPRLCSYLSTAFIPTIKVVFPFCSPFLAFLPQGTEEAGEGTRGNAETSQFSIRVPGDGYMNFSESRLFLCICSLPGFLLVSCGLCSMCRASFLMSSLIIVST